MDVKAPRVLSVPSAWSTRPCRLGRRCPALEGSVRVVFVWRGVTGAGGGGGGEAGCRARGQGSQLHPLPARAQRAK